MMSYFMNNIYWLLALNRMAGVGPRTVYKLLKYWPQLNELFRLSHHDRAHVGLSPRLLKALTEVDHLGVESDLRWQEGSNRSLLTWSDPAYPALLNEIPDPPPVLYVEGELDAFLKPTLAIVGTRNPSITGSRTARQFALELATHGLTIVSGLARGIDAEAHLGALAGEEKRLR